MRITDVLLGEHGVLYALFDELEDYSRAATSVSDLRGAFRLLSATLLSHAVLEDELLFPALEKRIGPDGPLAVMRAEHSEIERDIARLSSISDLDEAKSVLRHTLALARTHFATEEQVLFPLAEQTLDAETERLADVWAKRRCLSV